MRKKAIIQHTLNIINKLPDEKAEEISEFADFVMKRYEENLLNNGIQQIKSESKSFDFLDNEEHLYRGRFKRNLQCLKEILPKMVLECRHRHITFGLLEYGKAMQHPGIRSLLNFGFM